MLDDMERERSSDALVRQLMGDFNSHKDIVDVHMREFKEHITGEELKWHEVILLGRENAYAIKELKDETKRHREQTAELITLNTRLKSVGWFAHGIGGILGWFAAIIVAIGAAYTGLFGKV